MSEPNTPSRNSYHLFLDDDREPDHVFWVKMPKPDVWHVVRSYYEFIDSILNYGVPDFVSFDHDLADEHYVAMLREAEGETASYGKEQTGYDCAVWLVEHCNEKDINFPSYQVHSMNQIGATRIHLYIQNALKHGFIKQGD